MTVSSENYRKEHDGNGVTTEFAIDFYFLEDTDIRAVLYDTEEETETALVLTTNYTLEGAGELSGGTLTMLVAPAEGETLIIIRDVEFVQETDYTEHSSFPADSHENALDRLTMICQQLQEQLDRCLIVPVSQTVDGETPIPSSGRALVWNEDEDGLANSDVDIGELATAVAASAASAVAAAASAVAAAASAAAAGSALEGENGSVDIASGVVAVSSSYRWWLIDTEGDAASDDLDSFTGMSLGDRIEIRPESGDRTITVKHGTGIKLMGEADFVMNNTYDCLVIRCVSVDPIVVSEISRSSGGN